jgi:hypothetical protein
MCKAKPIADCSRKSLRSDERITNNNEKRGTMEPRSFLEAATWGIVAAAAAIGAVAADKYFPVKVNAKPFNNIHRVKDASNETPLEMSHTPFITAPENVKAGDPFAVEIIVGKVLHLMGRLNGSNSQKLTIFWVPKFIVITYVV